MLGHRVDLLLDFSVEFLLGFCLDRHLHQIQLVINRFNCLLEPFRDSLFFYFLNLLVDSTELLIHSELHLLHSVVHDSPKVFILWCWRLLKYECLTGLAGGIMLSGQEALLLLFGVRVKFLLLELLDKQIKVVPLLA